MVQPYVRRLADPEDAVAQPRLTGTVCRRTLVLAQPFMVRAESERAREDHRREDWLGSIRPSPEDLDTIDRIAVIEVSAHLCLKRVRPGREGRRGRALAFKKDDVGELAGDFLDARVDGWPAELCYVEQERRPTTPTSEDFRVGGAQHHGRRDTPLPRHLLELRPVFLR